MTRRDWDTGPPLLGVFLNGAEVGTRTPQGELLEDASFLILFNANHEDAVFTLPPRRFGTRWKLELTTSDRELAEHVAAPFEARQPAMGVRQGLVRVSVLGPLDEVCPEVSEARRVENNPVQY